MSKLLNDEIFSNNHIIEVKNEIEKLYRTHNSVRSIIDMVRSDDVLKLFYEASRADIYYPQDHEPELFLLRQTLIRISEYIGNMCSSSEDRVNQMKCKINEGDI